MHPKTGAPTVSSFELNKTDFPPMVGNSFDQHSKMARDVIEPQVRRSFPSVAGRITEKIMEMDIEDTIRMMEDPKTFQHHINDAAKALGVDPMMTIREDEDMVTLSMTAAVKQLRLILNLSPYESVTVWQGRASDNRSRTEPHQKSTSNRETKTKSQKGNTGSEDVSADTGARTANGDDTDNEGLALMRGGNDNEVGSTNSSDEEKAAHKTRKNKKNKKAKNTKKPKKTKRLKPQAGEEDEPSPPLTSRSKSPKEPTHQPST